MLNNKLLNQLLALTPLEEQQRRNQTFIEDLPQAAFDSKEKSSRTLTNYFFKNQDIYLSKHNRFAAYPNHKHTFFEMNYSYNRNYLSNLFKAEIGQTFSAVLTEQRLMQAHKLLTKTNLPVNTIIEQVGISNRSFFYKKYLAYYHVSPKQSRNQASAIFD